MKKIAIAGGTGFIGRHLVRHLTDEGYDAALIVRTPPDFSGVPFVTWDELSDHPDKLKGVEAIINLAGETINQRWTKAAKRRILTSRIQTTEAIGQWVERMETKPKAVINGSAVGIYGHSPTTRFTETEETHADDFLAIVVKEWEKAADRIDCSRIVKLRMGVVLGTDGGAFPTMMLPYRLFAGGRIGKGNQWLSWIHIEDLLRIIQYCLEHDEVHGPVNCTAPHPVTNDEFGRKLGNTIRRPHWLPVPAAAFRLLFGEMSALLLDGQYVLPKKLLDLGFHFKYPELDDALRRLFADQ